MAIGGCPFPVRGYQPGDLNRILTDWTSVTKSSAPFRWMDKPTYDIHDQKIKTIIPLCDVFIAFDPEMPSVIYGWAVTNARSRVLHMVCVRGGEFRNIGIASGLLQEAFGKLEHITYTCHARIVKSIGRKIGLETYNPYIIDDLCKVARVL